MMDEAQIEALKAKHGEIYLAETAHGDVVYRPANRIEFRQWRANQQDSSKKHIADELLVLACVVHPDRVAFEAMLDRAPLLISTIGAEVLKSSGAEDVTVKKL